jgi:hypothetical protein
MIIGFNILIKIFSDKGPYNNRHLERSERSCMVVLKENCIEISLFQKELARSEEV